MLQVWDQYGFEKMQSFSGALSRLEFWSRRLQQEDIKAFANCQGKIVKHISLLVLQHACKYLHYIYDQLIVKKALGTGIQNISFRQIMPALDILCRYIYNIFTIDCCFGH
jgi:hypothetical protein